MFPLFEKYNKTVVRDDKILKYIFCIVFKVEFKWIFQVPKAGTLFIRHLKQLSYKEYDLRQMLLRECDHSSK